MGCSPHRSAKPSQSVTIGGYKVDKLEILTSGAYGSIWLCGLFSSQKKYALKQMSLKMDMASDIFEKEVRILRRINQLGLKGSIRMIASSIHPHPKMWKVGRMLLELGSITLLDQYNSNSYSEKEVLTILKDVTAAVKQLHQIGVIHFDLKPENIIRVGNTYKLCDFGSALTEEIDFDRLNKTDKSIFLEYIDHNSTQVYSAPQMIEPQGKVVGKPSDIWMLGCLAYILAFGKQPFKGKDQIIACNVRYPSEGELTTIIKSMLTPNPKSRPTAAQLINKLESKLASM